MKTSSTAMKKCVAGIIVFSFIGLALKVIKFNNKFFAQKDFRETILITCSLIKCVYIDINISLHLYRHKDLPSFI